MILKNTVLQFSGLFGVLFVSGLVLTFISRWTNNIFRQFVLPKFGLYVFGVIGVPLHEFCHALFAKIFFHEIGSIKWFDPKGKGGSYGTVVHHYNNNNIYHRIGLFFIGLGPVILAPLFLFLIYTVFLPHPLPFSVQMSDLGYLASGFAKSLLGGANWTSLGFYVFLYLALCLTSQMELSPEDFQIARGGILPILLLLLLLNIFAYAFSLNLQGKFISFLNTSIAWWGALVAVAIFISLVNFVFCWVIFSIVNKACGKEAINPFREE